MEETAFHFIGQVWGSGRIDIAIWMHYLDAN